METRDSGTFLHQEKNMFDMQKVGERIAALRRKENMTQAELAEKLGISYQAVSSWERGATMPDIGKLVELARILCTTVDMLLTGENLEISQEMETDAPDDEKNAQKEKVIEEEKEGHFSDSIWFLFSGMKRQLADQTQYIREQLQNIQLHISGAHVCYDEENGRPVIKLENKKNMGEIKIFASSDIKKKNSCGRSSSDTIGALACYMDQETLEDELVRAIDNGDDDTVEEIACYLEPDTIDRAMERAQEPLTSEMLEELSTYMSHGALEECAVQALNEGDEDALEEIVCHMDDEVIERALERYAGELSVEMVEILACHASETALDRIIQKCDVEDSDVLEELAPYMNQRQMRELLKRMRNS